MSKKILGKNAQSLFKSGAQKDQEAVTTDYSYVEHQESVRLIDLDKIVQGRTQPRKVFDEQSIAGLAESIREVGVIQPIVVQVDAQGGYELIAGERRWRAAQKVGLTKVPAIIRQYSGQQASLTALIENIQREDLNPLDRAQAFSDLIGLYQLKQHELAEKVGLSRSQVTNSLRLLKLDDGVREALLDGQLTEGHAKILAGLSEHQQRRLHDIVVKKGLSVRQLEEYLAPSQKPKEKGFKGSGDVDLYAQKLQQILEEHFLTKARVHETGEQKGQITLYFHSYEQLQDILKRLGIDDQTL